MKSRELRAMDSSQLLDQLDDLKLTLFNLRFGLSLGQVEDTSQIKKARRTVARIKTIIRERQAAQDSGVAKGGE
ncbi:MAG: 50S ribosomal protein L29 [Phototrophicaceae bacterium]